MALATRHRDGGVIPHHLGADHGHGFTLGRIDLAGHDRGPRLVFRQGNLAQTRARAGAQQADVIGNLEQGYGDRVKRAVRLDQRVLGGQRLELVRCGDKVELGQAGHFLGECLGVTRFGIETGADGCAAHGQLQQGRQRRFDTADAVGDHRGIT